MSVTTRSQSKLNATTVPPPVVAKNAKQPVQYDDEDDYVSRKLNFLKIINMFINACNKYKYNKEQFLLIADIYKNINAEIPYLFGKQPRTWYKFICTSLNKLIEFENDATDCKLRRVEESHKEEINYMLSELSIAKPLLINLIKSTLYPDLNNLDSVIEAHNHIRTMESQRPRRKIPKVDYTGMDTIEPESEYDGITNIWEDVTKSEDPDYVAL